MSYPKERAFYSLAANLSADIAWKHREKTKCPLSLS